MFPRHFIEFGEKIKHICLPLYQQFITESESVITGNQKQPEVDHLFQESVE